MAFRFSFPFISCTFAVSDILDVRATEGAKHRRLWEKTPVAAIASFWSVLPLEGNRVFTSWGNLELAVNFESVSKGQSE